MQAPKSPESLLHPTSDNPSFMESSKCYTVQDWERMVDEKSPQLLYKQWLMNKGTAIPKHPVFWQPIFQDTSSELPLVGRWALPCTSPSRIKSWCMMPCQLKHTPASLSCWDFVALSNKGNFHFEDCHFLQGLYRKHWV